MDLLESFNTEELLKLIHEIIDAECGLKRPNPSTYSNFVQSKDQFENVCQIIKTKIFEILTTDKYFSKNATEEIIAQVVKIRSSDLKAAISEKCPIFGYSRLDNFDWNIKLSLCNNNLAFTDNLLMNLILNTTNDNSTSMETSNISIDTINKENSPDTLHIKSNLHGSVIKIDPLKNVSKDVITTETVSMELNQEELKYLIESLEAADKEIHQFLQVS